MLEPQCKVQLLHNTPLYIGAHGARTCWDSGDKSDTEEARYEYIESAILDGGYVNNTDHICGSKDAELLERVGNKFKHASILEHISYNFYISDVSRALLQELARHRMASLSVKSTRYTLKELKDEEAFGDFENYDIERAKKYIIFSGEEIVDSMSINALDNLRNVLNIGISNDIAKYCLPESYKTELTWTINARSLQNFISLRSDKAALWEIRQLAHAVYNALPENHKYLFNENIKPVK